MQTKHRRRVEWAQPKSTPIDKIVVVVHMQPRFLGSPRPNWLLEAVAREIEAAVDAEYPVILLEFVEGAAEDDSISPTPEPETEPELVQLLGQYRDWKCIQIADTNGAYQIWEEMEKRNIDPKVISIFGVETEVCVLDNTLTLNACFPKARIEVVKGACATSSDYDPWKQFDRMPPQVVPV